MSFTSARRDAWLIIGAKSVSWLGDLTAEIALVLHLQSHGAGAGAVSALLIANLLPILALSGVVGRLLDRHDNRTLLLAASGLQTVACTTLAFVSPTWAILGLVALLGAGQAVNGAAWQALLPTAVGTADLSWATGRMYAATTVAGLVAPPLAGLFTGWYGARVPLLIDAATFVLVAVAALLIRTRRGARSAPDGAAAPAGATRERGGVRIVWNDALLRPVFTLVGLFVLLASMVNVVEVFLIRETLGASTVWYGVAGGAFGLGAFAGALAGGRLHGTSGWARGAVTAALVLAVGLAAMGGVPSVAWLLPFAVAAGGGNGMLNVTVAALVMGRARPAERGRVGALFSGVASGMQLVAFAMAGALAGFLTPREIFIAAGVLGVCVLGALGPGFVRTASALPSELVGDAPENQPTLAAS